MFLGGKMCNSPNTSSRHDRNSFSSTDLIDLEDHDDADGGADDDES